MRLRKILTFGLSVIMFALVISGCASKPPASQGESSQVIQSESNSQNTNEKVKIVVWGAVPGENGPQDVCDKFMELNQDVEVEYVRYVNDDQGNVKLDTALMAGDQIDVFFTYFEDHYVRRIENGSAEDLTPWLQKDQFDLDENYGEGVWTYQGKAYGLPTNYDHQFVWANIDMFEKAGIPLPEKWTWEEYAEITKKLTGKKDGIQTFGGFMNWSDVGRLVGRGQVLGADSYYKTDTESNFDNPVFRQTLELFQKLMLEDKSHMSFVETTNAKLVPYGEFLTGKAATCISAPWIARYVNDTEKYPHDFKIAALPLPTLDGTADNYGWPGLTSVIMMNAKSEQKEAAYKFIKYFGTEGQEFMCRAGKIPSWKKFDQKVALKNMMGEKAEELYDVASFDKVIFDPTIKRFYNQKFKKLPEIERIWKEEVEKFVTNEKSIDDTLQLAKTRADNELK